MPPDRGRASKACSACRKQKTRCYETANGRACLRCERLQQECSLSSDTPPFYQGTVGTWPATGEGERSQDRDERVERLERLVAALARRLDDVEVLVPETSHTRADKAQNQRTPPRDAATKQTRSDLGEADSDQPAAPLFVLRDVTTQSGFKGMDRTATNTPSRGFSDDIVVKGLLREQDALALLTIFQEHYGRWVSFSPTIAMAHLLEDVRKFPLLCISCCLIAVRHTTQEFAVRLAPKLFRDAKSLLASSMLQVPQPIEFFQVAVILSLWSTTIGQIPLGMDSWLLSSFALTHSLASELFPATMEGRQSLLSKQELDNLCVWNHLCLAHLHYCVGTRRKTILDQKDINRSRLVLGSEQHATNFESRMVAEVHLYWLIYHSCTNPIDLPKTQSNLHTWKEEWGYLLDQPRSQFIQMGFYFAQLLAYDQSLKTGSAAVRESLLSEMVRLSTSIINTAMNTGDERTQFLSDHIYHIISFAAVTLCRLLHTYESQLSLSHDLQGLDSLILSLVTWLHAIGLPCHIAHTMGSVVAAFHKRLRPDSQPSPSNSYIAVDPAIQDDFAALFPEFYATSAFDMIGRSMLPDFQPVL